MRLVQSAIALVSAVLLVGACAQTPSVDAPSTAATATPVQAQAATQKVELTEKDFGCIRDMTKVRHFYVSNALGNLDGTLKIANNPGTGEYPVGSVLQLVPGEVMVKREKGYSDLTKDWEFLELDVSPAGTKIRVRGTTQAVNRFGGNCLTCHIKAKPEFDLVCDLTHGCDPIPINRVMASAIQNTDPRCPPMALSQEEQDALKALAAFMAPRPAAPAPAATPN